MNEKTGMFVWDKKLSVFTVCTFMVVDGHIEAECTSIEAAKELGELLKEEVIIHFPAEVRKPKVFSSEVVTCSHCDKSTQAVLIIYEDGYVSIICPHKKDDLCQPCRYEEK